LLVTNLLALEHTDLHFINADVINTSSC